MEKVEIPFPLQFFIHFFKYFIKMSWKGLSPNTSKKVFPLIKRNTIISDLNEKEIATHLGEFGPQAVHAVAFPGKVAACWLVG